MPQQAIHLDSIKVLKSAMASVGLNPVAVYQMATINGSNTYQHQDLSSILQAAIELSQDPTMALRLGQHFNLAHYGAYGFALMSSVDIKAALDIYLRFSNRLNPMVSWQVISDARGLQLRLHQKDGNPEQQQRVAEFFMSTLSSIGQFLGGRPQGGVDLHFAFTKPSYAAALPSFIPAPIHFEQSFNQYEVSYDWLSQTIKTSDPAAHVVFRQQCEEWLADLNTQDNTSAALRRLLIESPAEFPNCEQAAHHLHVSERTLQRRLDQEGTNFRTVCDEVRNVLAQRYLISTVLSIGEIAHLLGYSETVNFRRAFVRWNTVTPQVFRQQYS